jgi:hypothetical protein
MIFMDSPADNLDDAQWIALASLFSDHYGIWGQYGLKPGGRVSLNAARLKSRYANSHYCRISMAFDADKTGNQVLVGHALYTRKYDEDAGGHLLWISQLVVHAEYRRRRIGVTLCNMACGPRLIAACGIVSSNPWAIKCFQRAAGSPIIIDCTTLATTHMLVDRLDVSYMKNVSLDVVPDSKKSFAQTEFYVDHTDVNKVRDTLTGWEFAELKEGDEYLAILTPKR